MKSLFLNTQTASPQEHSSLLEQSWSALFLMGVCCCVLAVGLIARLTLIKPMPAKAIALRTILIPEAAPMLDSQERDYRFLLAQIVHRSRRLSFYEVRDLADMILKISVEENIDPLLVAAIVNAESTFVMGAVSNRGARGLMQIRSSTGAYISSMIDMPWQGEKFLHDPEYNLRLGIAYLKYLSKKFNGNLEQVLAAYNWGPGNVKKTGGAQTAFPSVTRHYVSSIMKNHKRWKQELKQQWASRGLEVQDFKELA